MSFQDNCFIIFVYMCQTLNFSRRSFFHCQNQLYIYYTIYSSICSIVQHLTTYTYTHTHIYYHIATAIRQIIECLSKL